MLKKTDIKIYSRECTLSSDKFSCSFIVLPDETVIELSRCESHKDKNVYLLGNGEFFDPIYWKSNYKVYNIDSNKIPFQILIKIENILHDRGIL